jgi:hypothetical protein
MRTTADGPDRPDGTSHDRMLVASGRSRAGEVVVMRHQRWASYEGDNDATTWTATLMSALAAVVRCLIVLLADQLGG